MPPPQADNTSAESLGDLTAEQILKRVREVYAGCASYEDAGAVETISIREGRRYFQVQPFITVFERSGRFRYEYTHGKEQHVIWAHGKKVKTWWNMYFIPMQFTPIGWLFFPIAVLLWVYINLIQLYSRLLVKGHNLGLALAVANGVSSGSAHTIPALLLPEEVGGYFLTDITDMVRIEDRGLENVPCFCIQGKYVSRSMLLWIDCATFLVRRLDEQSTYRKTYIEQTKTYYPFVNRPIDPQKFEFRPSRKRTD